MSNQLHVLVVLAPGNKPLVSTG